MDAIFRTRLTELVGARAVNVEKGTLTAASADQLALVCRLCTETHTPLAVTSRTAKDGGGPAGGLLVSLAKLAAVEVSPARLVVRAEAGAAVSAVRTAVSEAGLEVVGLPKSTSSTSVGGLIASGGVPRRSLCGIEAVLSSGETVRAGGAVLKDVTGYDLIGLLLGSAGRLAAITAVVMRLVADASLAAPTEQPPGPSRLEDTAAAIRGAFDPAGILVAAPTSR